MRILLTLLLSVLSVAAAASAQTVSADRFELNTGPCIIRSGSGTPEGVVTGNICDLFVRTDTGVLYRKRTGTGTTGWEADSGGTVTSVGLAMPAQFAVTGSPVTTSGTLTAAWNTQIANRGLFGPASGGDAVPTFRALVLADLPTDAADKVLISGSVASYSADPIVTTLTGKTSLLTPRVYAYGVPKTLTLGGTPTGGACTTNPPTTANCEALTWTVDAPYLEQRLKTDTSYRTRWYVGTGGANLQAWSGAGWLPLRLSGGPTELRGGGVHIGQDTASDPGVGNTTMDGYVGSKTFASQTTGWRIDSGGGADFRYLYTDELIAKSFIADLEQALAGGQIITKSVALLGAAFTAPAAGGTATLTMKDLPSAQDMAVFQSGDYIRVRSFNRLNGGLIIADAWGTVSSYADGADGLQTWTFTRLATNGGAMPVGTVVPIDAVALDYGVSGNGFLESSAIDGTVMVTSITRSGTTATATTTAAHGFLSGDNVLVSGAVQTDYNGAFTVTVTSSTTFTYTVANSPATPATGTILLNGTNGTNAPWHQVVTWAGNSPIGANQTIRTRLGNLRGITGVNGEYGLIAGTYASTNGQYIRASTQGVELHGIDLSLWNGATRVIRLDRTTPYQSWGNAAPTTYSSGTGCWTGLDSGTFKWRCGDIAGGTNYIAWNGSNLDVRGTITITSATGYANISDKPSLGSLASQNSVAWASQITGIPGTLGSPTGSGLFLSSTHMGFYDAGTWKTYTDSSGNFYLGGTGGKLTWTAATNTLTIDGGGTFSGALSAATGTFAGALSAATGSFSGTVTASAGTIGGWTIGAAALTGGNATLASSGNLTLGTSNDVVRLSADDATYRLWIGHATAASGVFRVTKAGVLTAGDATITGPSGYVSITSTGVQIATPGTAVDDNYAYKFSTAFTGTNRQGVYGYETSTNRWLSLFNTTTANKVATTILQAQSNNNGTAADLTLNDSGSATSAVLAADTIQLSGAMTFSGTTNTTGNATWSTSATLSAGTVAAGNEFWQITASTFYSGHAGTAAVTHYAVYNDNGLIGSITSSGSTTAYNTTSDGRLKTDIRPTAYGLADLLKIEVRDFAFAADPLRARHTGFLAQQLAGVYPEPVFAPADGPWQVDYAKLTPLLVRAVQELTARVAALEKEKQ